MLFCLRRRRLPRSTRTYTLFPDTTLFRSDLFWASYEVLKPAVYARPPQPVVAPLFKDNRRLQNVTAEMLERCAVSVFTRTDIDDAMTHVRDDVIFAGRGAMWLRYENEDGEQIGRTSGRDRVWRLV